MNWRLAGRVVGYCAAGAVAALGILGIHTFPRERTWVDAAISRYEDYKFESDHNPRHMYRDCGWRLVLCSEVPPFTGPLAHVADSLFEGVDLVECVSGMGWDGWDDGRTKELHCQDQVTEARIGFSTDLAGDVTSVFHQRGPDSLKIEFTRSTAELTARFGAPIWSAPGTDSSPLRRLVWQNGVIQITLEHEVGEGLLEQWDVANPVVAPMDWPNGR